MDRFVVAKKNKFEGHNCCSTANCPFYPSLFLWEISCWVSNEKLFPFSLPLCVQGKRLVSCAKNLFSSSLILGSGVPILEIEPLPELLLQSSKGVKTKILKANAAQRNRNAKIISVGLQDQEKSHLIWVTGLAQSWKNLFRKGSVSQELWKMLELGQPDSECDSGGSNSPGWDA